MNEQQRMQYLEAMGVDMFTPRWVLPGARASRLCELPVANAAPADEPAQRAEVADVAPSPGEQAVGSVVSHLLDTVGKPPEPAQPEPAAEATRSEPVAEEAAFSLVFWRVHPHIMVVDSRQPKALPTQALLQSVMTVMGIAERLPRGEIQSWPMPGSGDKSWSAAHEMIQAFLETRLLSEPVRYLVVMGEEAVRAVLGDVTAGAAESALPDRVSLDSFACEAIVTPSLADMLLDPASKARLWQGLAPLRQCVNG